MTWFANVHGGFEGPEGWDELPAIGLVEELGDPTADPAPFRRSMVLSGDAMPEGKTPTDYLALQKILLVGTLPGFALVAEQVPATVGRVGTLCYRVQPPSGPALVQRQAYFFQGERVVVLTFTMQENIHGTARGDVDGLMAEAMESFVAAG